MPKRPFPITGCAAALLAAFLVVGGPGALALDREPGDPLEPANRVSHRVSLYADRALLGPVARAYVRVTPRFFRTGVTNFVDNLTYPNVILNDFLQGKFEQGVADSMRFVINTTFGIAGLLDVATGFGLERHDEDFGQTLARWGVDEIAYLELPLLGPNSVRDVGNIPLAWQTSLIALSGATGLSVPVAILGAVNARANASDAIALRDQAALDSYVFTREAYRRRRVYQIMDGETPDEDEELYGLASPRQEHLLALVDYRGGTSPGRRLDFFAR